MIKICDLESRIICAIEKITNITGKRPVVFVTPDNMSILKRGLSIIFRPDDERDEIFGCEVRVIRGEDKVYVGYEV